MNSGAATVSAKIHQVRAIPTARSNGFRFLVNSSLLGPSLTMARYTRRYRILTNPNISFDKADAPAAMAAKYSHWFL